MNINRDNEDFRKRVILVEWSYSSRVIIDHLGYIRLKIKFNLFLKKGKMG